MAFCVSYEELWLSFEIGFFIDYELWSGHLIMKVLGNSNQSKVVEIEFAIE